MIPVLTAVAECFIESELLGMLLSISMAVVTSILICIDATRLGPVDRSGVRRTSPAALLIGGILLWIVFYPLAFFRRRHFADSNLGPLSLLVAVISLALPIAVAMMFPN